MTVTYRIWDPSKPDTETLVQTTELPDNWLDIKPRKALTHLAMMLAVAYTQLMYQFVGEAITYPESEMECDTLPEHGDHQVDFTDLYCAVQFEW